MLTTFSCIFLAICVFSFKKMFIPVLFPILNCIFLTLSLMSSLYVCTLTTYQIYALQMFSPFRYYFLKSLHYFELLNIQPYHSLCQ